MIMLMTKKNSAGRDSMPSMRRHRARRRTLEKCSSILHAASISRGQRRLTPIRYRRELLATFDPGQPSLVNLGDTGQGTDVLSVLLGKALQRGNPLAG